MIDYDEIPGCYIRVTKKNHNGLISNNLKNINIFIAKKELNNAVLRALKENKYIDVKYIPTVNGKSILAVKNQDEKWGVLGADGQMVQKCVVKGYEYCRGSEEPFSYGSDVVFSGEAPYAIDVYDENGGLKRAYVNEDGVIVLPVYDFATRFLLGRAFVRNGNKFSLIDTCGNVIKELPWTADDIKMPEFHDFLPSTFAPIKFKKDNGGKTYMNINGDIIERSINHWGYFGKDIIIFSNEEGKKGIVDCLGNIKIPPTYKDLVYCPEYCSGRGKKDRKALDAIIATDENDKMGLITQDGTELVSCQYSNIQTLSYDAGSLSLPGAFLSNLFVCSKDDRYGVINAEGQTIVPSEYDEHIYYHKEQEVIIANKDGKAYLYHADGTLISAGEYDGANFRGSVLKVVKDEKKGCINHAGEVLLPCMYDNITEMDNGLFFVKRDGKFGIVADCSKELVPIQYSELSYNYGLVVCREEGGPLQVMNLNGEKFDFSKYDDATPVTEELLKREYGKSVLLVDTKGVVRTKRDYTFMEHINGTELMIVHSDRDCGIIDFNGKEITPLSWSLDLNSCSSSCTTGDNGISVSGYVVVRNDKTYGCVDKTGWVVAPEYKDIDLRTLPEYGVVLVKKGSKWGMIDLEGNKVMCAAPKK